MVVLLAGGAGFIGSHMAVELLNNNYDVIIVDNFQNSKKEVINRIKKLTGKDFLLYEYDLLDSLKLNEIFVSNKIDYVIHLAALKSVGESVLNPMLYYRTNLNITINLCEAMKNNGVKNIIFSSSACVYSEKNQMPLTEDSEIGNCSNPYGWSKFMSEQILKDISVQNPDWSVVCLRYFNLIGADESGEIGEYSENPKNLPPIILNVATSKLDFLKVFGNDYETLDGSCIRDYIHITDLVKGHISAIKYQEKHKGFDIFNLGTGKGTSVFELVETFEKINNVKIPLKIESRREGDIAISYCSVQKANDILNWKAEKMIEDACSDMWIWQNKNPFGYNKN
ncbi:MAG: UDP-glucose 4-epimerase GalE [Defluviitaleaceae bacterium]|nr:UDP-glucose 4-epimerase GalE [Defluviitaleaceae bacterium]